MAIPVEIEAREVPEFDSDFLNDFRDILLDVKDACDQAEMLADHVPTCHDLAYSAFIDALDRAKEQGRIVLAELCGVDPNK